MNKFILALSFLSALWILVLTGILAYAFFPRENTTLAQSYETFQEPTQQEDIHEQWSIQKKHVPYVHALLDTLGFTKQNQETHTTTFVAAQTHVNVESRPNDIDVAGLEAGIRAQLGTHVDKYGVYLYDFKRGIEIGINADTIFPPMSISKVPVGIMMLREIDKGNFTLDQQVVLEAQDIANPTNVLSADYIGTSFAIRDYLRFLIIDSDNTSIRKLENIMGGNLVVNEKVKQELGVNHFFRQPHDVTARDIGIVLRNIYTQSYLSQELNDYFLYLLFNTHWSLQDGIPVGLPPEARIAHKTGQGSSNPGYIWEDAGIIYGEKTDYVLVIVNDFIHIPDARWNIQQISRLVYNTLHEK